MCEVLRSGDADLVAFVFWNSAQCRSALGEGEQSHAARSNRSLRRGLQSDPPLRGAILYSTRLRSTMCRVSNILMASSAERGSKRYPSPARRLRAQVVDQGRPQYVSGMASLFRNKPMPAQTTRKQIRSGSGCCSSNSIIWWSDLVSRSIWAAVYKVLIILGILFSLTCISCLGRKKRARTSRLGD